MNLELSYGNDHEVESSAIRTKKKKKKLDNWSVSVKLAMSGNLYRSIKNQKQKRYELVMSHSTHLSARVNQITGLVFFLIIFIISNKMNGISEYHKRRVYSSSNHYGLIYQFVTDRIFYESRCAGRGD